MSSDNSQPTSTSTAQEKEPNEPLPIDPALDLTSEWFNPLRALFSPITHLPVPNARLFDNVSRYESSLVVRSAKTPKSDGATVPHGQSTSAGIRHDAADNEFERRFLPHQMMVQGMGPKKRHTRTLLKSLETGEHMDGPMMMLKTFMDERKRVKIYMRNDRGIRGYMTGFVVLFDKHWNMVVNDVLEVWKRRKAHFCDPIAQHSNGGSSVEECARRLKRLDIVMPALSVKSLSRKNIECKRRMDEVLVRGEHIVCVMLDQSETVGSSAQIKQ